MDSFSPREVESGWHLRFSADGQLVASSSDDAFVYVWRAEDASLVASHPHPMPVPGWLLQGPCVSGGDHRISMGYHTAYRSHNVS